MDWVASLLILIGLLLAGLATGMPVAFVFLGIGIGGLYIVLGPPAMTLLASGAFESVGQFALVPVPLFILMGEILLRSGIATMAIDAADRWIGRVPGRLAVSTVAGGTMFGAISGSSMASVAMLGSVMLPEMERKHYDSRMSIASILGAGGLAVLIPPSALGVLLGAIAQVSIAKLLIASLLPGLVLALVYAVYFIGRSWLTPSMAPAYVAEPVSLLVHLKTLLTMIPVVVLIVVVTGFIFFGIATPSESAAMGAVAAALLAAAYGRLTFAVIRSSLEATITTSAMVLIIIAGSTLYSQLLASTGATSKLVEAVTSLDLHPIVMVIGMQVVVLIAGCFIDAVSIMLITVPIFMPIVAALGLDPIWVSVLILIQLELAGITPPFGLLLFVLKGVRPDISTATIYRAVVPVVLMQLFVAGLVMVFPGLALLLPNLMTR